MFSGVPDAISVVFKQVVSTGQQLIAQGIQLFQQYIPIFSQVFNAVLPVVQNFAVGVVKLFGLIGSLIQTTFQSPFIKAFVQALADGVSAIAFVVNGLIIGFNAIVDALQAPLNLINRFFNAVNNVIAPINSAVRGLIAGAWQYLGGIVLGVGNSIVQIFVAIGNAVKTVLTPPFVLVKNIVMSTIDGFVMLGKMAMGSVDAISKSIKQGLVDAINQIPGPVRAALTGLGIIPKGFADSVDKATVQASDAAKRMGDALKDSTSGEITTAAKDVDRLGTATEQLRQKVIGLQRQYKQPLGSEQLQATSKELVQATQDQLKFGQISRDEAVAQLQDIQNNAAVGIDIQQQAAQAVQQINQQSTQNRIEELKAEQSEVEQLVKTGQISELEGVKRTTRLKEDQLKEQLENTRQAILDELALTGGADSPRAKQLRAQEKSLGAQIEQQKVENRRNIGQAEIAELETQNAQIDAKVKQGKLTELEGLKQSQQLQEDILLKRIESAVKGSNEEKKLIAQLEKGRVEARREIAQAEIKEIQLQSARVQAAIASGDVGALDGEKQLTALKLQELKKRRDSAIAGSTEQKNLDLQIQQEQLASQKRISEIKLRLFDAEQKKALDAATAAEKDRQAAVQKLVSAGVVFEEDTAQARLEAERKRTEQELKQSQERQKQLELS